MAFVAADPFLAAHPPAAGAGGAVRRPPLRLGKSAASPNPRDCGVTVREGPRLLGRQSRLVSLSQRAVSVGTSNWGYISDPGASPGDCHR